jgi:hypothetical protein
MIGYGPFLRAILKRGLEARGAGGGASQHIIDPLATSVYAPSPQLLQEILCLRAF